MRKRLILVVDDEPAIVRLVRAKLQSDGYAVATAGRGEEALQFLEDERPDLVVLDLMMPGMDGFETLRRIRTTSQVPVILLTARTGDHDKLRGLEGGADDYITKPFNPDELAARVAAVLRRTAGTAQTGGRSVLRYPGVEIDLERRRVLVQGEETRLSRTEWELLTQLAGNAGRVMLHGELLTRIWGPEFRDEAHYLRTWVSRLRAKLQVDPSTPDLIATYPGLGYRMEAPASD
ncbi:MAG: two-component system, OmpR family, operon response regulator KdpE [Thermomicrobiales bacterium]|jgi:two-component system KDP operon response regulator KdpE|nr:two-component system, OmpR family, operon response regulator KdpE [Thermomicrobiales bacterium]MEA2523743.1 two-component system, OmpR family, operon response regulator KdpE [Thermomicrobiales bacterium]MEA2531069.1 two-component system, OmpR family, operon response regulator KdpE [Thermomicrobiales bacterium]MEA2586766.1 two-component system, OmpR family, operon response regulator KdpE [Thermomicrobiales bacterium]MEA2598905.1 two-component system, OmpR family, operon response regulator Kdp